jgi:hypothetical protein
MDGWRRNVTTNTTVLTYMGVGEEGVRTCGVRNTSFDHSHVATESAQLSINTFEVNYCTTLVKDIDQLDPLSFTKINLHEFWNAKLIACSLFNDNCSVTIMMNWKGFGRKRSGPNFKVTIPTFAWRNWGKEQKLNKYSQSLGPRIEPGISRIRSMSVNQSTTAFGLKRKLRLKARQ